MKTIDEQSKELSKKYQEIEEKLDFILKLIEKKEDKKKLAVNE